MIRSVTATLAAALLACLPATVHAAVDWVEQSNAHARLVLEYMAKFSPETAASIGVDGLDEKIFDLRCGIYERRRKAAEEILAALERRLAEASHPKVRQDLEILIRSVGDGMESARLERELLLPYYNVSRRVFQGVRALIDSQIPAERYPAAVVRLRRYAGLEESYEPVTELAMARTRERFEVGGLTGPYRGEVVQDLERSERFIDGIEELLSGTELDDWQQAYGTLAGQLRAYNEWLRREVLPRSRDDFRLPPALYADALKNWGVDETPARLIQTGSTAYMDVRNEMDIIGRLVAADRGYDSADYRDVIGRLKKDGAIDGDRLLDHYHDILAEIENIIVANRLVSLPGRPAGIRIGSAAETAAQPAPHLDLPRLLGNTGEYPHFVIPLITQNEDGSWPQSDDSHVAGSWTLTAHEARPGHEMQFSSMIEGDVSIARALFAFNSANVEGWGLYAEAITKPHMPLEGQLISLQYRLLRAARMFLDPMLNLGRITPEQAKQLLTDDVALSESWAQNEIERYTYRMPGQATAYYFGYTKLQALRTQTELRLRDRFDQQAFHDFILAQGLLPPEILKQAVMQEFIPAERRVADASD